MIDVWVRHVDVCWFCVAEHEGRLVATALARSRKEALLAIQRCLPAGAPCRFPDQPSPFAVATVAMLARLERGDESDKRFELSAEYLPEPAFSVLRAAAAIPIGYVSTYGDIAAVGHTNARVAGGLMAHNPLYPLVPCHRVVGHDMSLVGYTGRSTFLALRAKLDRLRAEARGFAEERVIESAGGLRVVPVERVIARAEPEIKATEQQLTLW
jgi:O-6-methylguanine DNA methyltransferase